MAGGSTTTPIRYDLAQFAQVSRVINSTSFVAGGLAGFDSGTFVGYSVWVLSKANKSSTPPKGELAKLISGFLGTGTQYPQLPGTITHDAFSAPLVVGDSVLLMHPAMASVTGMAGIVDGVCFNPVEGSPGTDWPVGTAGVPSNNLADALTIMRDRDIKKLYLVGARDLTGFHTGALDPTVLEDAVADPFKPGSLVGLTVNNTTDGSSGVITANTINTITVAALAGGGANIWTTGDAYEVVNPLTGSNPYFVTFDRNIDVTLVGNPLYDISVATGVNVTLTGDVVCGYLINDTGTIAVRGGLYANFIVSLASGIIDLLGDVHLVNGVAATDGNITVDGDMHMESNFTITAGTIYIGGNLLIGQGHVDNGGILIVGGRVDINGDPTGGEGDLAMTGVGQTIIGNDCHLSGGILNSSTSQVLVYGDCQVARSVTNSGGGTITILGKLDINGDAGAGEGYLDNTGGGDVFVGGDAHISGTLINVNADLAIYGRLFAGAIQLTGSGSITVEGDCFAHNDIMCNSAGTITMGGSFRCDHISNLDVGEIIIDGDCVTFYINNSFGGTITVRGKMDITGDPSLGHGGIDNTDGGDILITGDAYLAGDLINPAATITITGALRCGGTITNGGTLTYAVLNPEETQYEHTHAVQQVAPDGAAPINVVSGGGAYALGAFSNDIIAVNGDASAGTKKFDIHGVDIENPSANASYQLELYGTVAGVADTLIGKATFTRTNATTVSRSTTMQTPQVDAGSRIRAKLMDSTGGNNCNVKVWYHNY